MKIISSAVYSNIRHDAITRGFQYAVNLFVELGYDEASVRYIAGNAVAEV